MAVGGEWGGAVLMAVEHAPTGRKGLFGSLPQTGVGFGLILSSLATAVLTALPEANLLAWGWRIPFLASIVLVVIGWVIRVRVPESPDFERVKLSGQPVKAPVPEVLRRQQRELLIIIGARTAESTWFYPVVAFALAYAADQLRNPKAQILHAITAGAVLSLATMTFCGWLSDHIGQKPLFLAGLVVMGLSIAPFFSMLQTLHPLAVWWAMVLGVGVVFPILNAPEWQLFAVQFPAQIRYSGISMSVQVAGVLGGGVAPMIATALLAYGGGKPHYVVVYMIALAAIAFVCTLMMRSRHD
jgi:MFS transporter, MHS family, shikimate and dehydroshikimate transport protein